MNDGMMTINLPKEELYKKVYTSERNPPFGQGYMSSHGLVDYNEEGWKYPGTALPNRIGESVIEWWLEEVK